MESVFAEGAAYHTEENVLSLATYQEAATEVRSRRSRGQQASAMGLWVSVVEIQHTPLTRNREPELKGVLPAFRVAPCTDMPCQRRDTWRGASGCHLVVVPEGLGPMQAWRYYHEHQGERMVDAGKRLA